VPEQGGASRFLPRCSSTRCIRPGQYQVTTTSPANKPTQTLNSCDSTVHIGGAVRTLIRQGYTAVMVRLVERPAPPEVEEKADGGV